MRDNIPSVLTVSEVATILRVTPQTVRNMLRSGQLQGVRVGYVWRVYEDSALTLLQEDPNVKDSGAGA